MEYICRTIPLNRLILTNQNFISSLCNKCKTSDCNHPIEKRKISILGIISEHRVFVRGDDVYLVIECQGVQL